MSTSNRLVCWKCGAPLKGEPLPLARAAACKACNADLRVCRMCVFYEPRWRRGCREERAEDVDDKERANFCEYFKPKPGAFQAVDDAGGENARAQLNELFGLGSDASPDSVGNERTTARTESARTESDRAREELERLFGIDDKEERT